MSIGQRLLGMFQTQPDQFQSLLGEYYDPKTARMKWLGGTLQGLGMGLASGQPGAWATGLTQGGGQAVDDYRKQAMLGYQAGQQAEDKAYGREQDAKNWEYRAAQDAESKRRWEAEQARLLQAQRDQAAYQNLVRQNTIKGWQEADALKQGQTNAVNAWTKNFTSQGGDLFSPEMQTRLRAQGVQGVDPMDTVKFRQAQPYINANDVGNAFATIAAVPKAPEPYTLAPGAIRFDGYNNPIGVGAPKTPDTQVNVNTAEPPDDILRKELGKNEAKQWTEYTTAGDVAGGRTQDLQILDELLKIAPQGPLTGRAAEMFPGFSSAGDAAQAIVARIAPSMRSPGSGSTSDIEYEGFLKGLPRLRGTPQGNALVSQVLQAKNAIDIERGDIVRSYLNGDIKATEARARLTAINKRSILSPEIKRLIDATSGDTTNIDGYTIKKVK